MKPVTFEGSNVVYAKDQPEYLPLPAHRSPRGLVTSCWELTWRERFKLFFTGRFWWQQSTFLNPLQPVMPTIDKPVLDNEIPFATARKN